jgi:hypothetical protein
VAGFFRGWRGIMTVLERVPDFTTEKWMRSSGFLVIGWGLAGRGRGRYRKAGKFCRIERNFFFEWI